MSAKRCTMCGISFPAADEWAACAQCGGKTDPISNDDPTITQEEAQSILKHRKFEEYLEQEGRA